jgi:hypothetical protein
MLRDESVVGEECWGEVSVGGDHRGDCERVHRKLRRIVKARGLLDTQEAEALREAEKLRVWRHYGYASLLEYMELEMGYPPRVAVERLRVANAIVELPAIAEAMTQGDLSFSAARELTRVATPETEQVWLEATNDKNVRDVESMVAGHKRGDSPDDPIEPKLRKRKLRFDELDEETVALVRQARQILERELGERLDDNQFMRALARRVVDEGAETPGASSTSSSTATTTKQPRTKPPYQIAVTTCDTCKRGWQDGAGIVVEMSPPMVEVAHCDAVHIGHVDDEKARARTDIPPALRRKVHARDHGRCRVPGCRSSHNVDQHHLEPISEGGEHTLENLITLCESHHIALHDGSLVIEGDATKARFTRRANDSFTLVERAVETAAALKSLGFDKHEVRTAVEITRTHVGTSVLTLEQWIKIALGYCPKPRS